MDRTDEGDLLKGSGRTFEWVKATVADLLNEAAEAIHQKSAGAGHSEISELGERAVNWLEHSADYVREIEPQRLRSELEDKIRRNPGRSLIIAGIVGLVVGSVLRRR